MRIEKTVQGIHKVNQEEFFRCKEKYNNLNAPSITHIYIFLTKAHLTEFIFQCSICNSEIISESRVLKFLSYVELRQKQLQYIYIKLRNADMK